MRKELIFLILLILIATPVLGFGISPYKEEIFFSPDSDFDMSFRILNRDAKDLKLGIFTRGALADYIELENEMIDMSKDVYQANINYRLRLPPKMKPGNIEGEIVVIEMNEQTGSSLIKTNLGAAYKVIVNVPYPGEYAQGILHITDAEPGEKVFFTITLANLGTEPLDMKGSIYISNSNQGVASLKTERIILKPGEKGKIVQEWVAPMDPGTYHAYVTIEYGQNLLVLEDDFDVGIPLLDIEDIKVSNFKLGTIAKMDLVIKNNWNKELLFDSTSLFYDQDANNVGKYEAKGVSIKPLATLSLPAYWDTQDISEGTYTLSTEVSYLGRVKQKDFMLDVSEDKITISGEGITGNVVSEEGGNSNIAYLFIGIILSVSILAVLIIRLSKKPKKTELKAEPMKQMSVKEKVKLNLKQGIAIKSIKENLMRKGYSESEADRLILEAEDELR